MPPPMVNHRREDPSEQPTISLALLHQVGGSPGAPGAVLTCAPPGACAPPMSIARIAPGVLPRAIMRHRFSPDSTPLTIEPPREKKERQTVASAALASGRLPGEGSAGSRGIHRGIGRGRRGGVAAGLHVT